MSYRKRHIKSKIHKTRPRKSIFKRIWFWIIILSLIFVFATFYLFIFYSGIQVKNIIISGNQKADIQNIQSLVSENINIRLLKIGSFSINSKSIFLINTGSLDKKILNNFPIIESVQTQRKFFQTIEVQIKERVPVAVFCPQSENCYSIDAKGIIFEPLSENPQGTIIVFGFAHKQFFAGEQAVSQNTMNLFLKAEKNLKDNFQIDIKKAVITSPARMNITTSEGWQAYFDLDLQSNADSQIAKLNLTLNQGVTADERKNLRYINLIPKDKAIICDNSACGQ